MVIKIIFCNFYEMHVVLCYSCSNDKLIINIFCSQFFIAPSAILYYYLSKYKKKIYYGHACYKNKFSIFSLPPNTKNNTKKSDDWNTRSMTNKNCREIFSPIKLFSYYIHHLISTINSHKMIAYLVVHSNQFSSA